MYSISWPTENEKQLGNCFYLYVYFPLFTVIVTYQNEVRIWTYCALCHLVYVCDLNSRCFIKNKPAGQGLSCYKINTAEMRIYQLLQNGAISIIWIKNSTWIIYQITTESRWEKVSLKKISFLLTDYSVQKHPCAIADLF